MLTRRQLITSLTLAGTGLAAGCSTSASAPGSASSAAPRSSKPSPVRSSDPAGAGLPPGLVSELQSLERHSGRRIGFGLYKLEEGLGTGYRATERFAMCSTYKVFAVANVLHRATNLDAVLRYSRADVVAYSPVTAKHVGTGMSLRDLCAAAIEVSDNTAANLLLRQAGGPAAVTAFLRTTAGDGTTRLDRYEPDVNSATPGDDRDTSTPAQMADDYARLTGANLLTAEDTALLQGWLRGCTTGRDQIRAVAPHGWTVGDKTGHGEYGTTNDVAVLTPPGNGSPIALAVLSDSPSKDAANRNDVVHDAARLVFEHLT